MKYGSLVTVGAVMFGLAIAFASSANAANEKSSKKAAMSKADGACGCALVMERCPCSPKIVKDKAKKK